MRHKDLKGAIPNETAALAANSQTWYKTKLQKNYIISIIFFLLKNNFEIFIIFKFRKCKTCIGDANHGLAGGAWSFAASDF